MESIITDENNHYNTSNLNLSSRQSRSFYDTSYRSYHSGLR